MVLQLLYAFHWIKFAYLDLDVCIKLSRIVKSVYILHIIAISNNEDHQLNNQVVTQNYLASFQFYAIRKKEEEICLQLKSLFPGTPWEQDSSLWLRTWLLKFTKTAVYYDWFRHLNQHTMNTVVIFSVSGQWMFHVILLVAYM